tara:strand:- start:40 stop:1335 length:1296 start_codon:yes stop_codon:yes gene_type:complete
MKKLKSSNKNFYDDLSTHLKKRSQQNIQTIDRKVKKIITEVINKGDRALYYYAKKFDNSSINESNILISKKIINSYKNKIDLKALKAFQTSIVNVTKFHKKQRPVDYKLSNADTNISSVWKPIDSVGLYIPGGQAVYPTSLIMNVIPAKVAGVKRIVLVTPSRFNEINPYILALIEHLNISECYQIGGAHAIAALAYGTKKIKPVDKIFGPGNAYVSSAKKQVFGKVGIDLLAGPSEIVIVAQKNNNPKWVAADLIAQAEHDEKAQSILITDSEEFSKKVLLNLKELVNKLPKKTIINKSLYQYGLIIITKDIDKAYEIINFIAPEHLHLQNKNYKKIIKNINNAGCIFLGDYSTEAFGDYIIGTNHVLPTSGTAKFSSGLGVLDFMKRISLVNIGRSTYELYQDKVSKMAEVEKLEGHKLSVKIRQIEKK